MTTTSPKSTPLNFVFIAISLFLLGFSNLSWGQTEIFNLGGGGVFPAGWSDVDNVTANSIDRGSYYLVEAGSPSDLITSATYDLSAYASATFSFDITSYGSGNYGSAKVEVSYDGGLSYTQTYISPAITSSYVTRSFSLTSVSNQVVLRISHNSNSGRGIRLRNLILEAIPPVGPSLVASPLVLTGLDYVLGSGPSAIQTFILTGSNLNGTDDIELLTGAEFEISSDNITFSDYINLGPLVSVSQTIYVRLKAGLIIGNYADIIFIAGGGVPSADEPIIDIFGEVYEGYDINFYPNGGTGTMSNQSINSGATENLNTNTFTRTGFAFSGWSTTPSGTVVYTDGAPYTMGGADQTLYAQWSVFTGPCVEEDFESIGTTSSYGTKTWSGFGGSWIATNAREDQTINGKAICFRGNVTSPTFTGGIGDLTITTKYPFSDGSGTLDVLVNGIIVGSLSVTQTVQTHVISGINILGSVYVEVVNASGSKRPAIDDLSWTCYDISCTPTASITSFLPNSGPAGTLVTITGSGFTGATEVKFGTTDATIYTIIDVNTIIAEVPAGISPTETISVFDASGCEAVSTGAYSLTTWSGTCSAYPGYTDLFMSEIYDHSPGDGWYLELYNPTNSPILLTGVYQIERYGNLNLTGSYNLIDLIGTVPPMSVFVIQLHSVNRCNGLPVNFQTPADWGINADDRIRLVKNGTVVDDVSTPAYTGYTLLRDVDPLGVAPSTQYPSVGWTTLGSHDCSDIGNYTLPPSTDILVTAPVDVNGCSLSMSVSTVTPGVTYQWKYNNPTTNTWLNVNATNLPGLTISGENSANLSIDGNLVALDDFQFYCEVSEGGCSSASDAAQFKIDSRPIYRSVAGSNGNWSDYSNWEMSTDYINYIPACSYPRDVNSTEVIIQSGTYIVLDLIGADVVTIDKVTIENTGTLELLPSAQLTLNNSVAGSDLIVNGTLYDRSNSANSLTFNSGVTWEMGADGTLIKSNRSSVVKYRDFYELGMSSIPATANWIYRYNGDGEPIVGTINFFYPNLSFENTTATSYSWGGITNSFNGVAGIATVKGDFNVGVSGVSSCIVSNTNFNVQPMLVYGDMHIATGSSLINNNTVLSAFGTGFELKGNLIVDGLLRILGGTTQRIQSFTGSADQTVSGTGTIDLYKMTVNKPSGNVLLNRDLQAQNELVMAQGHIFTYTNILELGLSTTQKGTLDHTQGFVVGKMRRWFNGTNSGDGTGLYPMGFEDSGLKNRNTKIEFTGIPVSGGHLTVEYIGTPMGSAGLIIPAANSGGAGFDVSTTEDQGYWKIDNEAGKLVNASYTIACTGEGYQTINDLSMLTLLKRDVANGPNWFCPGVHLPPTGTIAMPVVSRSGVSNWSNFGFGSVYLINPLPITLTSFEVACSEDNQQMNIKWSTSSESNSSHFEVEKSRDMLNWSTVANVQASGNSNHTINYEEMDANSWSGVAYYRLKQFDFNGDIEIFNAISASCKFGSSKVNAFPNPSNGNFTVEVTWNEKSLQTQLQVVDVTGRIISSQDVSLEEGVMQFHFNQIDLQTGIYMIVFPDTELKPHRVMINN